MRRLIFCLIMSIAFCSYADVNTDRAMAKIAQDTKTYIVADARAATEDEAYNLAFEKLSAQIADYLKSEHKEGYGSDAVYLSSVSSIYDKMTSKISDSRYRVMLYIKKSDVLPLGNTGNSVVLERQADGSYAVPREEPQVQDESDELINMVTSMENNSMEKASKDTTKEEAAPEPAIQSDKLPQEIFNALLSVSGKQKVAEAIQNLRKENKITSAAAFPMSKASDFYVVAINPAGNSTILHFDGKRFINVELLLPEDISKYSNCTGYWFTID